MNLLIGPYINIIRKNNTHVHKVSQGEQCFCRLREHCCSSPFQWKGWIEDALRGSEFEDVLLSLHQSKKMGSKRAQTVDLFSLNIKRGWVEDALREKGYRDVLLGSRQGKRLVIKSKFEINIVTYISMNMLPLSYYKFLILTYVIVQC